MTRHILRVSVIFCSMLAGVIPATTVFAQDVMEDQEERLDRLFVQDNDQDREARFAEFEKNNPEAAARMKEHRKEMESRRAEFAAKYPEAAAEMKAWKEADMAERKQNKADMDARRAAFESKYPEAAAEMKAAREQQQTAREQKRQTMEARRKQFEEKYPEAAAELKQQHEAMGPMGFNGGQFKKRPGAMRHKPE